MNTRQGSAARCFIHLAEATEGAGTRVWIRFARSHPYSRYKNTLVAEVAVFGGPAGREGFKPYDDPDT